VSAVILRRRLLASLGIAAAGLGIAAALTVTPGVASADDSSTDPFWWLGGIDLADLMVPATSTSLDYQISVDGMDLLPTTGNSATAISEMGDIAVASGNGAFAEAGGTGDVAWASGGDSYADADYNYNVAFAAGTGSLATAGGFEGITGNHDIAEALGDFSTAEATDGSNNQAWVVANATTPSDGSSAFADLGNDNYAFVADTGSSADYAEAGGYSTTILGNYDMAEVVGTSSDAYAGASPTAPGDFDWAEAFGNFLGATATGANLLIDIVP
jgi:hypothetical protein